MPHLHGNNNTEARPFVADKQGLYEDLTSAGLCPGRYWVTGMPGHLPQTVSASLADQLSGHGNCDFIVLRQRHAEKPWERHFSKLDLGHVH